MKRVFTLIIMAACSAIIIPLVAQTTITGNIQTEIVAPITVEETEQLNFGKILTQTSGGTVQISPDNNRVSTGNVALTNDIYNAGSFVLATTPNSLITVVLPQGKLKLHSSSGSGELTVDQFVSNISSTGQNTNATDGKLRINIGATLYVGDWKSNPTGTYTGTYEIVFPYN